MNKINELKGHNVFLIPVMSGIDAYCIVDPEYTYAKDVSGYG